MPVSTVAVPAVGDGANGEQRKRDAAEELDFQDHLDALVSSGETLETTVVSCPGCGATPTLAAHVTADECPFCSTPLVTEGSAQRTLKPGAVLPFRVVRSEALQRWRAWMKGLWFAPSRFKERARLDEKLQGVYFPFWTYDCQTTTEYVAERGDDEYVTRRAAMSSSTGGAGKGSRRVRKTRWKTVRGTRTDSFDDVLIPAPRSLSSSLLEKLEPWDLEHLESHRQEFLSGFRAESYGVGLAVGFERARERIGSASGASSDGASGRRSAATASAFVTSRRNTAT